MLVRCVVAERLHEPLGFGWVAVLGLDNTVAGLKVDLNKGAQVGERGAWLVVAIALVDRRVRVVVQLVAQREVVAI